MLIDTYTVCIYIYIYIYIERERARKRYIFLSVSRCLAKDQVDRPRASDLLASIPGVVAGGGSHSGDFFLTMAATVDGKAALAEWVEESLVRGSNAEISVSPAMAKLAGHGPSLCMARMLGLLICSSMASASALNVASLRGSWCHRGALAWKVRNRCSMMSQSRASVVALVSLASLA